MKILVSCFSSITLKFIVSSVIQIPHCKLASISPKVPTLVLDCYLSARRTRLNLSSICLIFSSTAKPLVKLSGCKPKSRRIWFCPNVFVGFWKDCSIKGIVRRETGFVFISCIRKVLLFLSEVSEKTTIHTIQTCILKTGFSCFFFYYL